MALRLRLPSLLMLGVGYWMIFSDARGRDWNDRLAGTRVVRTFQSDRKG